MSLRKMPMLVLLVDQQQLLQLMVRKILVQSKCQNLLHQNLTSHVLVQKTLEQCRQLLPVQHRLWQHQCTLQMQLCKQWKLMRRFQNLFLHMLMVPLGHQYKLQLPGHHPGHSARGPS